MSLLSWLWSWFPEDKTEPPKREKEGSQATPKKPRKSKKARGAASSEAEPQKQAGETVLPACSGRRAPKGSASPQEKQNQKNAQKQLSPESEKSVEEGHEKTGNWTLIQRRKKRTMSTSSQKSNDALPTVTVPNESAVTEELRKTEQSEIKRTIVKPETEKYEGHAQGHALAYGHQFEHLRPIDSEKAQLLNYQVAINQTHRGLHHMLPEPDYSQLVASCAGEPTPAASEKQVPGAADSKPKLTPTSTVVLTPTKPELNPTVTRSDMQAAEFSHLYPKDARTPSPEKPKKKGEVPPMPTSPLGQDVYDNFSSLFSSPMMKMEKFGASNNKNSEHQMSRFLRERDSFSMSGEHNFDEHDLTGHQLTSPGSDHPGPEQDLFQKALHKMEHDLSPERRPCASKQPHHHHHHHQRQQDRFKPRDISPVPWQGFARDQRSAEKTPNPVPLYDPHLNKSAYPDSGHARRPVGHQQIPQSAPATTRMHARGPPEQLPSDLLTFTKDLFGGKASSPRLHNQHTQASLNAGRKAQGSRFRNLSSPDGAKSEPDGARRWRSKRVQLAKASGPTDSASASYEMTLGPPIERPMKNTRAYTFEANRTTREKDRELRKRDLPFKPENVVAPPAIIEEFAKRLPSASVSKSASASYESREITKLPSRATWGSQMSKQSRSIKLSRPGSSQNESRFARSPASSAKKVSKFSNGGRGISLSGGRGISVEDRMFLRSVPSFGGGRNNNSDAHGAMSMTRSIRHESKKSCISNLHNGPGQRISEIIPLDDHEKPAKKIRTRLCRNYSSGRTCTDVNCTFAHGLRELQPRLIKEYKMKACKEGESCSFGDNCKYRHGEERIDLQDGFSLLYSGYLETTRLQYVTEDGVTLGDQFQEKLENLQDRLEKTFPRKLLPTQFLIS